MKNNITFNENGIAKFENDGKTICLAKCNQSIRNQMYTVWIYGGKTLLRRGTLSTAISIVENELK